MFNNLVFECGRVRIVANAQGWTRVINLGALTGAAVFAVNAQNEVLLVKEKRIHTVAQNEFSLKSVWNIPRGAGTPGEPPINTAKREFHEETGITVPPEAIQLLGYIYPDNGFILNKIPIYLVSHCEMVPNPQADPEEIEDARFFSWKELQQLILQQELEDAFTLSAMTLYRAFIEAGSV